MSVPGWLRKGLGFLLMSFGVSRPEAKRKPQKRPLPQEDASGKNGPGK